MFPAEAPQYVILVKLDGPKETIFGGTAAAPVSRIVLQAAIAAGDATLDRNVLASTAAAPRPAAPSRAPSSVAAPVQAEDTAAIAERDSASAPVVLTLPAELAPRADTGSAARAVPDVRGLSARQAARALHRAGFRVAFAGSGMAAGTRPAAGVVARSGSIVTVVTTP
jgi:hypothetical protein